MGNKNYLVLAFYKLVVLPEPRREVSALHQFFKKLDAKARIYLSEEGINAQMSLCEKDLEPFKTWMESSTYFSGIEYKIHHAKEHVFPKVTIKYRKQLAVVGCPVDLTQRAEPVSTKKWKEMLSEKDENTLILDVRNHYEWDVGHFEGAQRPQEGTFREFPEFVKQLKEKYDVNHTRVLMYCTGGIRCEFFSPLLKQEGFNNLYQLDGGVIQYGLKEGNEHWKGNLFVFDDRLVVPICDQNSEAISRCYRCHTSIDSYYNCANMDCNALFVSCSTCAHEMRGCCCSSCIEMPRRRAFEGGAKPYRKLPFEEKERLNQMGPTVGKEV